MSDQSTYLANLLWEAQLALTKYRRESERLGMFRLALSDLATFDALEVMATDLAEEDPQVWARDHMAVLIAAGEQPSLDDSGSVYQGHADEVSDALERLGLLPEEES